MSKLLADMIGKECRIAVLGMYEIKGTIIDLDDEWVKFQYIDVWRRKKLRKEKVKMIKKCFISSILIL